MGMHGMTVGSKEYLLAIKLKGSLKAVKDYMALELVLHRGVHDVQYGGAHTIRIVWDEESKKYLCTKVSLVSIGENPNSIITLECGEDVIQWLFDK